MGCSTKKSSAKKKIIKKATKVMKAGGKVKSMSAKKSSCC